MTRSWFVLLMGVTPLGSATELDNLDFSQGFSHWKNSGFVGADNDYVTSQRAAKGTALLYRSFIVPKNIGTIHFSAFARTGSALSDRYLDVYLEAAGQKIVPKLVDHHTGWRPSPGLLPSLRGKPRHYVWSVAEYIGRRVRIVLVDQRSQKDRDVVCSGFQMRPLNAFQKEVFKSEILALAKKHSLRELESYSSIHFQGFSNANEDFTIAQMRRCETMYSHFFSHFRKKGFRLNVPVERMMVTIFRQKQGLVAYMRSPLPLGVTGLYHPPTNRLVVYDFGNNRALKAHEKKESEAAQKTDNVVARRIIESKLERRLSSIRNLANISTIMHETAHQLSFNTGMLNRKGDVPVWLAEGLACYCESTDNGVWKGIGKWNPLRASSLRQAGTKHVALRDLIKSNEWLHGPQGRQNANVGYAQSWALFHMLITEEPEGLRRYMILLKSSGPIWKSSKNVITITSRENCSLDEGLPHMPASSIISRICLNSPSALPGTTTHLSNEP